jgi:uncharacterized protein involved in exopolysaccharide biosynthesis
VARPFISRLLETFFRRKWLYLLPLVPFLALGVLTVLTTGDSYRSTGLVRVNLNTTVDQVNEEDNAISGETPAAFAARQLNDQLQTNELLHPLMRAAEVEVTDENEDAVRRSVWAAAAADDLVTVNAATANRDLSFRLADATIRSYRDWRIQQAQNDSDAAVAYFTKLANEGPARVLADANQRLKAAADLYQGPLDQQSQAAATEIGRLTAEQTAAQDAYNVAMAKVTEAQQAGAEAVANIPQQFRAIDDPEPPQAPEPRRKQDIMTLAIFTILGLLVSGAALVVGTLMDRSVRFSDEIEAHLDVPVIATIPDSGAAVMPRIL